MALLGLQGEVLAHLQQVPLTCAAVFPNIVLINPSANPSIVIARIKTTIAFVDKLSV